MTADTSEWHRATITRTGQDRLFTAELLNHHLALNVDQATWDNAVNTVLTITTGLDTNADAVTCRPGLTEADEETIAAFLAVARTPDGRSALEIPDQREGAES